MSCSTIITIDSGFDGISAALRLPKPGIKRFSLLRRCDQLGSSEVQSSCSSWYKSRRGKVIAMFPRFNFTYQRWTRHCQPDNQQFG